MDFLVRIARLWLGREASTLALWKLQSICRVLSLAWIWRMVVFSTALEETPLERQIPALGFMKKYAILAFFWLPLPRTAPAGTAADGWAPGPVAPLGKSASFPAPAPSPFPGRPPSAEAGRGAGSPKRGGAAAAPSERGEPPAAAAGPLCRPPCRCGGGGGAVVLCTPGRGRAPLLGHGPVRRRSWLAARLRTEPGRYRCARARGGCRYRRFRGGSEMSRAPAAAALPAPLRCCSASAAAAGSPADWAPRWLSRLQTSLLSSLPRSWMICWNVPGSLRINI